MRHPLSIHELFIPNDDGWMLHARQVTSPQHHDPALTPVVIVPGYGMNAFIFGFHPRGTSMERCLAEQGLEVWSVNLRRQGPSRPTRSRAPAPSMRAYAETDLSALLDGVLARTHSGSGALDVIGCSLGGSIAYAHLALRADHRIRRLVTVGSPLRWDEVPPLFKAVLGSPALVARIPVVGSQPMARVVFPLFKYVPRAVSVYMNPSNVDLSAAGELTRTVEDPHPRVNADIARWFRDRDLVLRGVNVTRALANTQVPLLVVTSNRDGIVPDHAALSVRQHWGGPSEHLVVGDDHEWYAHADLFIGNNAPSRVFAPIAQWLKRT